MRNELHAPELDPVAGRDEPVPPSVLCDADARPPYARYEWTPVVLGIILAGGSYPIVAAACGVVVGLAHSAWLAFIGFPLPYEELAIFPIAIITSFYCSIFGMAWAGIACLVTLPVFYLFVRSLKLQANFLWLSAVGGGLVGLLAVLPIVVSLFLESAVGPMEFGIVFGIGPGLTTILGQIGGARGARRSIHQAGEHVCESLGAATDGPFLQFSIRHLLLISFWVSVLLTVIRLCQLPAVATLVLFAVWALYQTATLWFGWWIVFRLAPRWRARRNSKAPHLSPLPQGEGALGRST
jgi:hypothetical protein